MNTCRFPMSLSTNNEVPPWLLLIYFPPFYSCDSELGRRVSLLPTDEENPPSITDREAVDEEIAVAFGIDEESMWKEKLPYSGRIS